MASPSNPLIAFKSAHARYARRTALSLGYDFRALDVDGYLFEVRDGDRRAHFSAGAGSPYAFNRAHALAIARDKAFAQGVLADVGLPTIPSRLFFTSDAQAALRSPGREPADARAFARSADYPLFCKPIDASQGTFAEIIADAGQFDRYLTRVSGAHYAILAQPLIEAPEQRVFVLQGRVLFCYRKRAARVLADGASSLATLAAALSELCASAAETLRGRDGAGRLFHAGEIPPVGAEITLQGAANRALGGGADAPRTEAPEALVTLALACTTALRLDLAAVDLFETSAGLVVIEVNANPAIKTLEDYGRWDLIETIWRANIEAALQ